MSQFWDTTKITYKEYQRRLKILPKNYCWKEKPETPVITLQH